MSQERERTPTDERVADERSGERPAIERYYERTERSREYYEEACEYMPGGSTRGVLYYDPYPAYVESGSGPRLTDVDGNEYLDFLNNYTSLIHGHAPEEITEAGIEAARRGSAPGGPTREEIDWAKHLVERAPAVDQLRFTNSGTEAMMNAIRAARAYTGQDAVAKFEGVYHGTHDDVQVSVHPPTHLAGPREDPKAVPDSAGVPESTVDDVVVLPFNDADTAVEKLQDNRDRLGGIMLAPMMGTSVVPATDSFLEAIQTYAHDHDIPLILDEVVSFRLAHGGAHDAFDLDPDLVAYGKVIGGGFPVGAFGGRRDIMADYDPRGGGADIVHSGTFNANPVTAAAGLAALERFSTDEVARLNRLTEDLADRARDVIDDHGLDIQVNQVGSLFKIYLTSEPVTDYRSAHASPTDLERTIFMELLTEGIRLAPKLMGCLSTPMGEDEVDEFIAAFDTALGRVRSDIEMSTPQLLAD
ncbi:MAG: aspartate aminotransferase family protein [Halobacteriales archaeon]